MKKLQKFTLTITFLFASVTSFAFNPDPKPNNDKNNLHTQIVKLLGDEIPEYLCDGKQSKTKVYFIVNNKDEIVVVSTDCNNDKMSNYLKGKLNYKKINSKGVKKGEVYIVPLRVKK